MLQTLGIGSIIALLLVWVGYPLMISMLASCRRRATARDLSSGPTISFVIATRESDGLIAERVRDCLRAEYELAKLEVVVAIDARRETPAKALTGVVGAVTVVAGDPPGGKAATLNAAVRASRGEVLVFTDSYQRFAQDAVARLVETFWDPQVGAVSGVLEAPRASANHSVIGAYRRYEQWLREREARLHSSVGVVGGIHALRRALWKPLPPGLLLDDVYIPMQVVLGGKRVELCPLAEAWDIRGGSPGTEYHRKVRTLTGVLQLCAWLPAVLNPRRNPIWLQFLFHKILRLLTPYWVALASLWAVATALTLPSALPTAVIVVIALAIALISARHVPTTRRLAEAAAWFITIQAAAVVATANGVRGRWDVWQR